MYTIHNTDTENVSCTGARYVLDNRCLYSLSNISLQNIFECICIKYIKMMQIMLQNVKMRHYFESYLKHLHHNAHSKPPASSSHSAVSYCPAIAGTVTVPLLRCFVSVCMTETGTVVECGGSTHQHCTAADL
jgi:hypothetical protein